MRADPRLSRRRREADRTGARAIAAAGDAANDADPARADDGPRVNRGPFSSRRHRGRSGGGARHARATFGSTGGSGFGDDGSGGGGSGAVVGPGGF